ncbi:MAG: NAD(P)-dependent oxidoreductase [Sulfurospirillaceae bacterium]|nr:NAD(P)-dependent oxidoreductase [Sulfurospirillaceae bacterium]
MRGKVLITGGLGNLGSWLTSHFVHQGFDVYVLSRKEKFKLEGLAYTVIEVDISNLEELKSKITMPFDFCIHTASLNEHFLENYAKGALLINALGTRNLLEVLSVSGIKKFIYMSTFHVYGANSGHITEQTSLLPKNDYASTHLFAEYYIKQFAFTCKLDYVIFRLTNSYGCPLTIDTNKWYLVVNDLAKSAHESGKIMLKTNGKAQRDFIWMGDVCRVVEASLGFKKSETYNLSSGKSLKILEIAMSVQKVYEKRYQKPLALEINALDCICYEDVYVDNAKLKSVFNFQVEDKIENEVEKIFQLLDK